MDFFKKSNLRFHKEKKGTCWDNDLLPTSKGIFLRGLQTLSAEVKHFLLCKMH